MSAYLVKPEHIGELIKWIKSPRKHMNGYNIYTKEEMDTSAEGLVKTLAKANIDSLVSRYGDNSEEYKEFSEECLKDLKTSRHGISLFGKSNIGHSHLDAKSIWNMAQCLEYQSCEVDNWIETDAYWILSHIQTEAGRIMASEANVGWSYDLIEGGA
jgi:hypothetical protein